MVECIRLHLATSQKRLRLDVSFGTKLESGCAVVKVLSVLEVCPLGVQVFSSNGCSNDFIACLYGLTITTHFMGPVENPQAVFLIPVLGR